MKISIRSIQALNARYGCAQDIAPQGAQELAERIGAQLGAIEETIDIGAKYQGIIIAKVVSCTDHPDADRLHVCKLDDGGKAQGVERDADGYVQVVCGAPNVREGMLVAWLPPGTTVPESYGSDPFVLEARPLRGVVSNGMLASPRELALGDSHEGILEIDAQAVPGADFAEQYNLAGDVILDIENKMFTHRPDCFGFLGVSRELAGIRQLPFKSPEWYRTDAPIPLPEASLLGLTVRNEVPKLVPRFMAVAMSGVKVSPSPVWLQVELVKAGLRPINNIVDLTNFFMLETGQPLHAYDYDKVAAQDNATAATIVVRHPKPGERISLLNGKDIQPRDEAVMIATEKKLIGVGGVMGGADTEVGDTTTNIIIEVANFDMYSVRRTSMAHGLFTDAVTRFNKGQSPLQNRAVLAKMVDDVRRLAGGKVASEVIDDNHVSEEILARRSLHPAIRVSVDFINQRLGLQLTLGEVKVLLENVEFTVTSDGEALIVTAPFWRTDIEIPEDVVEEVGRLYGFDRLPLQLPRRSTMPVLPTAALALKQSLRDSLSAMGANEVLSYSFVHGKLLEKAGQNPAKAYRLGNALSPDLQYFRLSLTPSLLDRVHANIKAGYSSFCLFEIGKAHVLGHTDPDEAGLPKEFGRVATVVAADPKAAKGRAGAAYYEAKVYLVQLLGSLNIRAKVSYEPWGSEEKDVATTYYQPGRAASIVVDGQVIGRIGEYSPAVRRAFKLPEYCAGFELSTTALQSLAQPLAAYVQLSRFPKAEQDISLRVGTDVSYQRVYDLAEEVAQTAMPANSHCRITPVDLYQSPETPNAKHVTLRLQLTSYDKTLRDEEVGIVLENIATAAADRFGAVRL